MPRCYLSLGGNVGPVEETFQRAFQRMRELPRLSLGAISGIHRTEPVGAQAGGPFLNLAAEIETDLPPLELLDSLQAIEAQCGRTRGVRWSPRTLDIDVVLYGGAIIDVPRLRIPHPACWYRRFVLDPLVEIAADVVHPERNATFGTLRERLLAEPMRMAIAGGSVEERSSLIRALEVEFTQVEFSQLASSSNSLETDSTFTVWLGPTESGDSVQFDSLPAISRLDVSAVKVDRIAFLTNVLHAALGR